MLDRRRQPGSRAFLIGVVLVAVLAGPLAAAGWFRLNQPATAETGRADHSLIRTAPTVPPAPEPTTTTVPEPVAAPEPEPEPQRVAVAGSRLRRGVARAVPLPAIVADVEGSEIGLYSTPGQAEPDDVFDNPTW